MPIYEFYCADCHTLFNFFSKSVNTSKQPACPRCGRRKLERQVSLFSMSTGRSEGESEMDDLPIDETKMASAMESLAGEAEKINEDDPRQAAQLMRKFSKMTGVRFGEGMEAAMERMEAGDDPEAIEAEMGDVLETEEPFLPPNAAGRGGKRRGKRNRGEPSRDPTLYDL